MQNELRMELALALARYAYNGVTDDAGRPYIEHLLEVAERLPGENEKIEALLHETADVTSVTPATIRNLFGERIADTIELMHRPRGVEYLDHILTLSEDTLARTVKQAELSYRLEQAGSGKGTDEENRSAERYRKARKLIENRIEWERICAGDERWPLGERVLQCKDQLLRVLYRNGMILEITVDRLAELEKALEPLKDDRLFSAGEMDTGGYGIVWTDELDFSLCGLFRLGKLSYEKDGSDLGKGN